MLTQLNLGTAKPTLARLATATASIPREPSAPVRPASSAPVQASYFGSGSITMGIPPASNSSTNEMGFSLGGIVKGIGSLAGSVLRASPIGNVITTAAGLLHPQAPAGPTVLGNLPTVFTGAPRMTPPPLPALAAGAAGGVVKAGDSGGTFVTPDGVTHAKVWRGAAGHYKKDGSWSNRRRPRMNPMNVRAARRAVSRIHSAEKLFRRILQVSHPGKAGGRIAPKRRKRA